MIRYEKYKSSEIDWLGDIPNDWEVKRVKDLADYQSGYYIDAMEFDKDAKYPVYGGNGIRGNCNKYNHFGDYILIGRQGALCGNINYAKDYFWATEHAVVVYKKKNTNMNWLGELLRIMNLNQYALSAAQPGLSVDKIKRLELPFVPFEIQNKIADFINTKTQAIDKKINLLTQKANYYKEYRKSLINETVCKGLDKKVKLKDSGIEWIGQIPQHWEVKRFKDVCYKNTTGGTPSTSSPENFYGNNTWVTIADLGNDKFVKKSKLGLTDEAIKLANIPITPKGSLIYSFKLTVGKIAFAKKDLYTNEALISIMPNKLIDLEYCYFMLPIFLLMNATENIYGAKMLNQKLISNTVLVYPPLIEQTQIAHYLDQKTQTIDKIVSNINTQIATLKELRKTLINDAVTGKIKVVS